MTNTAVAACPPDAYQHEPGAPAHRHGERCHCGEPFADEEPAAAQIARLKAELATATCFERDGCTIEARNKPGHPRRWAVLSDGNVLNMLGEWEWEPQPSSRSDAFKSRTRFHSVAEADAALARAKAKEAR